MMPTLVELVERAEKLRPQILDPALCRWCNVDTDALIRDLIEYARETTSSQRDSALRLLRQSREKAAAEKVRADKLHAELLVARRMYCGACCRLLADRNDRLAQIIQSRIAQEQGWDPAELWPEEEKWQG